MKYLVLSQKLAEDPLSRFIPSMNHVIISITDPDAGMYGYFEYDHIPSFPKNPFRKGILRLKFHDADPNGKFGKYYRHEYDVLFNKKMAQRIVKFVKAYKDSVELIVVHCYAGISRSSAVAAALSKFYEGNDDWFFSHKDDDISEHYMDPNMLVYCTLLKELLEPEMEEIRKEN